MTTSDRMSTINVVLRELEVTMSEIDKAKIQVFNKTKAAKRASSIESDARLQLHNLEQERDRLREAADVLNKDNFGSTTNWRSWPWVKEAGFAKEL